MAAGICNAFKLLNSEKIALKSIFLKFSRNYSRYSNDAILAQKVRKELVFIGLQVVFTP